MIEILEIRDKTTRELIGNIDTAKSIIWKSQYYGVGEFEIYVAVDSNTVEILQLGNYVTRIDGNTECGIIEHLEISENSQDGKMIVASGRFIKSIFDRRVIYSASLMPLNSGTKYYWSIAPTLLSGNVETAVRKIIYDNAISCWRYTQTTGGVLTLEPYTQREIKEIDWNNSDVSGLTEQIVVDTSSSSSTEAQKQVTYQNLLEYTDSLLKEYKLGAKMWLDRNSLMFRYKVYKGVDRSRNSAENPIIFSKEYDNLVSSSYVVDNQAFKTTALIGGAGEGSDRKCALVSDWFTGLERRETFVDADSISDTYDDENGETQTYENDVYRKMLEAQGQQTIASLNIDETFEGEIDLTNSPFVYGREFNLGDIVTVEDKEIKKYIDTRILTITEVQDDDGYKIEVEYGE